MSKILNHPICNSIGRRILYLGLFLVPGLAQSQVKPEILYHKYKNEIGIDVQYLFANVFGGSLVYKHRKPETGLIAVNEKTAYRFQFSLSGEQDIGKRKVDTLGYSYHNAHNDLDAMNIRSDVGIERQIQRGRFQYFMGADLGYYYSDYEAVDYYRYSSQSNGNYVDHVGITKTTSHGPILTGIFGFKFFIIPEISFSIETGLSTSYNFRKVHETERNLNTEEIQTFGKYSYDEISFYFDFLRALNLSYYF